MTGRRMAGVLVALALATTTPAKADFWRDLEEILGLVGEESKRKAPSGKADGSAAAPADGAKGASSTGSPAAVGKGGGKGKGRGASSASASGKGGPAHRR